MNKILKKRLLPSLIATGLIGATFIPAKPASADRLLKDVVTGAGVGAVSGVVTKKGSTVDNAINGAVAGAAVNAANRGKKPSLVRDAAVGAAASTVSGVITRKRKRPVQDAVSGAVTGILINQTR
ncbi:MAG: hypothetical protein QNJ63_13195 [Calothrix sp. MO_192.B10]|nr:hypothetical protein [Calothrix sp. MO_192.B10]